MDELVAFWTSNPHLWFDASHEDDIMITAKFEHLLDLPCDALEDYPKILLYDQIARHVCRVRKADHAPYFERAFEVAQRIIERDGALNLYDPIERVFILLVYRHTFQIPYIEKVIELVQTWMMESNNSVPIYRRFYQASLQSLAKLKNREDLLYYGIAKYHDSEIDSILDREKSPKMKDFMTLDHKALLDRICADPLYLHFEEQIRILPHETIIGVSISGGVDSMVCMVLLSAFLNKHQSDGADAVAFTVNYGNRCEQDIEIEMTHRVIRVLGNIKHYVRKITEIKRTQDHNRELYEDLTRNIRFDCYKIVGSGVPFILGHNRDDALENIVSNIKKERSYQNLFGMNPVGNEKGVSLWRPLLSIWKSDIIAFAQKYGIPFVYDSTPSWSERGKMRDILFPFLNQFDPRILDGLYTLATNYKEIYRVYESSLPHITFEETCAIVEDKKIYFEDYMKRILQQICGHYRLYPVRNKSICHLLQTLKSGSTHRISVSKQIIAIREAERDQIIFMIVGL